ncbi:MAG: hypothetical protein K2P81_07230 [Bacteriovoracaceae bacterium]|nr:hypothetical protein [Bacteriovoracaceae bacterium]
MKPILFLVMALGCISCAGTRERLKGSEPERKIAVSQSYGANPSINIQIFR